MNRVDFKLDKIFDTEGAIFMSSNRSLDQCKIALYGVPYDGTTSFRPGARFGPSSIKNVSNVIETYCPQLKLDLEEINFSDLGSLNIPYGSPEEVLKCVKKVTEDLYTLNIKPLMLGGEHSLTIGALEGLTKFHKDLVLLQLDAHADLRELWLGSKYSHACTIRRCLEIIPSQQIFQVGIRSGTKKEFEDLKTSKRLVSFKRGDKPIELDKILKPYLGNPIYITIDLDWFDPSIMPGTGTPEPGGFYWEDFASILDIIKEHNIIGADIVELSPDYDTSNISSILAAKITRSMIMILNQS